MFILKAGQNGTLSARDR